MGTLNFRRLHGICIVVLVALMFSLTVHRAIELNMDMKPGMWAIDAIPVALSTLAFGHKQKYTANAAVNSLFKSELITQNTNINNVNLAISKTLHLDKSQIGNDVSRLGNDDKGVADFVTIAFRIFGYKVQSLLYFYFLVLFISCSAYAVAFYYAPARFMVLLTFLIMLYLVLPMIAFHDQLVSVLALRVFPILSMVATLHCIIFALDPKLKTLDLVLVAIQVMIIMFVLHVRTTTQWQLIIIGLVSMVLMVRLLWKKPFTLPRRELLQRLTSFWPIFLLIIGFCLLLGYRSFAFEAYYNSNLPVTRVFWHNIFSGLAFEPNFAKRYQLIINDSSIVTAAGNYLHENNRGEEWQGITGTDLSSASTMQWDRYDQVVKEMLFHRCAVYPYECFKAVSYYKPRSLIKHIAWLYGLRYLPPDLELFVTPPPVISGDIVKTQVIQATKKMDATKQRAYLWSPVTIVFFISLLIALIYNQTDSIILYSVCILVVGSFIPSVVGYPAPHTILEAAIACGMLLFSTVWLVFSYLCMSDKNVA